MEKFQELKEIVHKELRNWQESGEASFNEMKEIIGHIIER